jgi:hypothetical protein
MSSIPPTVFPTPDVPKLNLSPQARAKLFVLTFLLQQSAETVLDRAMDSLIENSLPPSDKDLVPVLQARFVHSLDVEFLNNTGGRLASQIRTFVTTEYVRPAREKKEKRVTVRVREIHRRLGLTQRYPAVISALQTRAFLEDNRIRLVESSGAKQGSTRVLIFELL